MSKLLTNVFEAPLHGISLVEASAGTGKTYNITSLCVRAIIEKNLLPSQILVMTYTEAATAELKYRIRERLNESLEAIKTSNSNEDEFLVRLLNQSYDNAEEKLQKAIDLFDEAAVFTIHGFCNRILTEYSLQFEVSPNFELLTDDSELLQDCVDDYWRAFAEKADQQPSLHPLVDYLTDISFGPDELKSVLSEVMKHPDSVLEPQNLELNQLLAETSELEKIFNEVKSLWKKEGDNLEEIYRGDALNRGIYRKNTEERHWESFQYWLHQSSAKISYPDELEKFGLKISRSGKKAAPDIPELDLCAAIDEYREKADRLKLLKPAFIIESVSEIKADFKAQKKRSNLLTYNDLLEITEKVLSQKNSNKISKIISKKYPVALVDEFQDTDPIQYNIFRQIYYQRPDTALFMIGDPKQAIYGFRGADIYTYLEARRDAMKEQRYALGSNYRANNKMIEAVNTLFTQNQTPFLIDGLHFNKASFPNHKSDNDYLINSKGKEVNSLQCIKIENSEKGDKKEIKDPLYTAITNEILDLINNHYTINGNRVQQKDIAILIRSGYEGEEVQLKLKERGLKSVMRSRNSVFKTNEAGELFLILKSVYKPGYEPGIRAALTTEMLGYSAQNLLDLFENEQEWASIVERFLRIKEQWNLNGIESAIEKLFSLFDIQLRLADLTDAERRITNLLHLSELLARAEREQKLTGIGLLKWFHHKLDDENSDSEDEQLRLESDEDLIQISTMHGAKGLEYKIVFCPYLWVEAAKIKSNDILKFHLDGKTHLDVSTGVEHANKEKFEELTRFQQTAESVRLAYVALTRSVSACYMFVPQFKNIEQSPLGVLFAERPQDSFADFSIIKEKLNHAEGIGLRSPVTHEDLDEQSHKTEIQFISESTEFLRKDLAEFPSMISYSMLSRGHDAHDEVHDYDSDMYLVASEPEEKSDAKDKYTFPKGANAGTCLHKIFEDISFNNSAHIETVISENLDYYGFEEEWQLPVLNWVQNCLHHQLKVPPVSLSDLPDTDVLKEMEFLYPVKGVQADEIWKLIRNQSQSAMSDLATFGFMKGFIDLIFRHNNRYYILDYKSNFLGDTQEDYTPKKLNQAIEDAGYDLQYHIYTLALHRYLQHRQPEYSYENNFGGVLYFFLRGVNTEKTGSGIYFDRPDIKLVHDLDKYFREGGSS